ncbi:hypothetical protein GS399_19305 [Pedobacter sp. HMF7647]|uniref:Uncharacterized protein n=1 Tax=Hufsiella arboris TaxID=2695275 RepID=A0A7K1YGH0_9SPHI|nr:hypothetical protein [Hufsiella arboris]MXV53119.1 hypothetical protein [Hufsiella arboris]
MNYRYLCLPCFIFLFSISVKHVSAQDLRGVWNGYLTSDTSGVPIIDVDYLLNIKEQTQNIVRGRAYIYRNAYFIEGSLDFVALFENSQLKITELRIVNSSIPKTFGDRYLCIKRLKLNYSKADTADFLKGHWQGNIESGERCIPGGAILSRPRGHDAQNIPQEVLDDMLRDPEKITRFLGTRLSNPVTLTVKNRVVKIELRDYLKEDHDTVTVYYNRRSVIKQLEIVKKPYLQNLRLDRTAELNEVILYANNLGRIPPNTSTLTIDDGFTRQAVNIESSLEVSAVIYLQYKDPNP